MRMFFCVIIKRVKNNLICASRIGTARRVMVPSRRMKGWDMRMKYGVSVWRTRKVVEEKLIVIDTDSPEWAQALAYARLKTGKGSATDAHDPFWDEILGEKFVYSSAVNELDDQGDPI
jgi:hypothetical protein